MLISVQDSARVGETLGISSEMMYNFKCLNAKNNP